MYLSIRHSRQYLEMVWLYRDRGNIWYDQTQKSHFSLSGQALLRDARQSCTWSGKLTVWILLNCLMMLWTYLVFTYFCMCEWVCLSTQDQFSCLFLCLCVLSLVVWKVFVLHVCNYSCGDMHLHLPHLHLPVSIIWWTRSQQRAKV